MNTPKDILALLPVRPLTTRFDIDARAKSRRGVLIVVAASGWAFFVIALALM